jgi:hypothetical protein
VLDNRAWRLLGEDPLPDWREGLTSYLATLPAVGVPGRRAAGLIADDLT